MYGDWRSQNTEILQVTNIRQIINTARTTAISPKIAGRYVTLVDVSYK